MITLEQLGIKSKNVKSCDIIEGYGELYIKLEYNDGKIKEWNYGAVPTEENTGQGYSPIKWILK